MKVLKSWLQDYIEEKLPSDEILEKEITMRAFEIESTEKVGEDTVFDFKIIPDRAHDCLSHRGIAREIASLLGLKTKEETISFSADFVSDFDVKVEDSKMVPNFAFMEIKNIKVGPSPFWLVERLEKLGQRSINNIVDVTNYVMLSIGKPMHAFDADKIQGGTLYVRRAEEGETVVTLDNKEIKFTGSETVIADSKAPLSIAGIKGGKKAEVDNNTVNIILESANFLSSSIRKSSQKVNIKTDASKRFESELTSELSFESLIMCGMLIKQMSEDQSVLFSEIKEFYPRKEKKYTVGASASEINKILGYDLNLDRMVDILKNKRFEVSVVNIEERIKTLAKEVISSRYKRGASVLHDSPKELDCSSLSGFLWGQVGVQIPRIAVDQYVFSYDLGVEKPSVGDLVFTNTGIQKTKDTSFYSQVLEKNVQDMSIRTETVEWMPGTKVENTIDHVGVYMGEGNVLHASSSNGAVVLEKLSESTTFANGFEIKTPILNREDRLVTKVPFDRLDVRIKEDLADEIGRNIGYESSIKSTDFSTLEKGEAFSRLITSNQIRNLLKIKGFSEVMTYSFAESGDIAIVNSVDPKKNKMRTSLSFGLVEALNKGIYYREFLGLNKIQIFEIGSVFKKEGERVHLAIGVASNSKKLIPKEEDLNKLILEIKSLFGLENLLIEKNIKQFEKGLVIEIDLNSLQKDQKESSTYIALQNVESLDTKYQSLSPFPFITRDISVLIDKNIDVKVLENILEENSTDLCTKIYQFDKFQKEGETKTAFGYRLVFQSFEKTLEDIEVSLIMDKIYMKIKENSFEIR